MSWACRSNGLESLFIRKFDKLKLNQHRDSVVLFPFALSLACPELAEGSKSIFSEFPSSKKIGTPNQESRFFL